MVCRSLWLCQHFSDWHRARNNCVCVGVAIFAANRVTPRMIRQPQCVRPCVWHSLCRPFRLRWIFFGGSGRFIFVGVGLGIALWHVEKRPRVHGRTIGHHGEHLVVDVGDCANADWPLYRLTWHARNIYLFGTLGHSVDAHLLDANAIRNFCRLTNFIWSDRGHLGADHAVRISRALSARRIARRHLVG